MGRAQEGLSLAALARVGRLILHVHHIGPNDPPEGWRRFLPALPSKAALLKLLAPREGAEGGDHRGSSDPLPL